MRGQLFFSRHRNVQRPPRQRRRRAESVGLIREISPSSGVIIIELFTATTNTERVRFAREADTNKRSANKPHGSSSPDNKGRRVREWWGNCKACLIIRNYKLPAMLGEGHSEGSVARPGKPKMVLLHNLGKRALLPALPRRSRSRLLKACTNVNYTVHLTNVRTRLQTPLR